MSDRQPQVRPMGAPDSPTCIQSLLAELVNQIVSDQPAPFLTHQDPVDTRLAVSQLAKESFRHSSDHHPTKEDFSLSESPTDCKLQKPVDPVITLPGLPVAATTHADTLWWPAFLRPAKDG